MKFIMDKMTKIAICQYENKHNWYFKYEEVPNKDYLILSLNDYVYFFYNIKKNEIHGLFYQILTDGLFQKESKYFIGFQKSFHDNKTYCNIYNENNKNMFTEDFSFIHPEGLVRNKSNIVFSETKIDNSYTKYQIINVNTRKIFEIRQNYSKMFVKEIKNILATGISFKKFVENYKYYIIEKPKEVS